MVVFDPGHMENKNDAFLDNAFSCEQNPPFHLKLNRSG
jgi:hypothetical protein